jgi:uncharacterized membrane protein
LSEVKRFPFLDWMRGLAVVLMIQCHVFNSYALPDARQSGTYVLSQFVGGMAAPLFLFMAGMTLAFQMESVAKRETRRLARWLGALRRGAYVLGIAYLVRFTNCVAMLPTPDWNELTKVDILNCMGLSMLCCSAVGVFELKDRVRAALVLAAVVAAVSPIVANLAWGDTPTIVQEYLAPGESQGRGRFPLFPNAAYVAFGIGAGSLARAISAERFERVMQWAVLVGLALVFTGQYFSNIPYSMYAKSSFWMDSPTLVAMRCGIALLLTAGSYLWTEYGARAGWSWMQTLGKNSLMVYWVHVMLVYGDVIPGMKGVMSIPVTAFATAVVMALMVAMSAAWLWWKGRRAERWRLATSPAGKGAEAAGV